MMAQDSTSAKGKDKAPVESRNGPEKNSIPNIIPKLAELGEPVQDRFNRSLRNLHIPAL